LTFGFKKQIWCGSSYARYAPDAIIFFYKNLGFY